MSEQDELDRIRNQMVDNMNLAVGPNILPAKARRKLVGHQIGTSNMGAKMPSALAKSFKKAGLDWRADFATAIMKRDKARMAFWLRLLPYLVTRATKPWKGSRNRGQVSAHALAALNEMEGK